MVLLIMLFGLKSCQRIGIYGLLELLIIYMGIDLSSGDALMSKYLL